MSPLGSVYSIHIQRVSLKAGSVQLVQSSRECTPRYLFTEISNPSASQGRRQAGSSLYLYIASRITIKVPSAGHIPSIMRVRLPSAWRRLPSSLCWSYIHLAPCLDNPRSLPFFSLPNARAASSSPTHFIWPNGRPTLIMPLFPPIF